MGAYFLDSSALVKRYLSEAGSPWVLHVTHPSAGNRLYIVRIAPVEVASAITRKEREGALTSQDAQTAVDQLRQDVMLQYRVVAMDGPLAEDAVAAVRKHALRAYDAAQLAAALSVERQRTAGSRPPLTFVCADAVLNAAAAAEGLVVEDPNSHP
ncbi:MAG: type II toxin-antitoxin system VapC family toxin [Armatimonadetes bacterium]|nr:type II toxin-antitoxin system VapC family toxin [Armatimonadota bacterium]